MRKLCISLLLSFLLYAVNAQDSIPVLKGKLLLSVKQGTMDCYFTLSNMPRIDSNYVIRINSGMNIHYFKNAKQGNLLYFERDRNDTMASGESIAYYFPGPKNKGRFLPLSLEMHYKGMFPVINDTSRMMVEDWRGNIAFNGYSLRTDGLQSAWYPVLYDLKKQKRYEKVMYDIEIVCPDCSTLYVNGSNPVKGTTGHFVATKPQELTLYCGNYQYAGFNDTYVLNSDMDAKQTQEFGRIINSYKQYLASHLAIPYREKTTFVQTTPNAKDYGFLFVSFPAILSVNPPAYGLRTFFDPLRKNYFRPFIAHELAHYYFGHSLTTNSEFADVIEEGFTEYLSWKITKNLMGDSAYKSKVEGRLNKLKDFNAIPFASVHSKNDYGSRELYVYYYTPFLLTAIESEIGEQKMWAWMRTLLQTPTDFTNYAFLKKTLAQVVTPAQAKQIEANYFTAADALQRAMVKTGWGSFE